MRRAPLVRTEESGGEQGFWPSYADMMSAVALILFFLMLLSYISNLITGNDLKLTESQLDETRAQVELARAQAELARAQAEAAQADYDAAMSQYVKAQKDLQGLTNDLNQKQADLEMYAIKIAEQTRSIEEQEKLIEDQKAYLAAANNEIVTMRSQMQTIAVLRLSILNMIKESIIEVMGDASKVSIGDNGNIILSEGIFFDLGSSAIKPESVPVLNELIDVFSAFLSNENNAKYVDSIVISGHTDSTGTDEDNRKLSTDRANSVLSYLLAGNGGELTPYSGYFCAAGYGETRPVADNSTLWGQAQNRRIEISMILKDESVLDIVDQYLAITVPEVSGADAPTVATPVPSPSPTPGHARFFGG